MAREQASSKTLCHFKRQRFAVSNPKACCVRSSNSHYRRITKEFSSSAPMANPVTSWQRTCTSRTLCSISQSRLIVGIACRFSGSRERSAHSSVRASGCRGLGGGKHRQDRKAKATYRSRSRSARRNYVLATPVRSEEHTSELQSRLHLVCRLLLEKKN